MLHAPRLHATALASLAVILAAGCGASGGVDAEQARARSQEKWKLHLDWAGSDIEHALERMDIYLVDPEYETEYAETFDLYGEGVRLVGAFPMNVRAGYGEDFESLVGRTVTILERGGDPRAQARSFVRLSGVDAPVTGGTMTFEKLSGQWSGSEGDRTLWGTVELRVMGADGEHTLKGAFAVHAVTWG